MPRRKRPAPPPDDGLDDSPATTYIPPPVAAEPLGFADTVRFKRLAAELVGRQCEALKLYEPLPVIDRFHADARDERLLRGSNRAGKTLGAAVELARAVTGQDPYGKYPARDGKAFLVGLDEQHLGDVMYAKLFRAQAFKMIRDGDTGLWRAYRPWDDGARAGEAKWAPPLIPRRFVLDISWKDKKRNVPGVIRLTTGWELYFFSSKGSPPQGSDIDLAWPDEEIENEQWYPELSARLLDRRGKFFWSATPQIASQQLYDLHVRAEAGDANVGEHIALLEDNPHIGRSEKDKLYSKLATDEERRVRIMGEFALSGFKVYPEYSKAIHGLDWDGPVPADWCRYMVVDPGRQVCAVLFGGVPPPALRHSLGADLILYDELYIKQCDAAKFGEAVKGKSAGASYEAFLIDSHASRVTEMGSGLTVEAQFQQALHKAGVKSRRTGSGFLWGADDPKAGQMAVHALLRIQDDGRTRLRVLRGRLPHLEWEVERYHFRRINKLVSDEAEKKHDHLMDCLRYLALARPEWRKPAKAKAAEGYAAKAVRVKRERAGRRGGGGRDFVWLGPGKGPGA